MTRDPPTPLRKWNRQFQFIELYRDYIRFSSSLKDVKWTTIQFVDLYRNYISFLEFFKESELDNYLIHWAP